MSLWSESLVSSLFQYSMMFILQMMVPFILKLTIKLYFQLRKQYVSNTTLGLLKLFCQKLVPQNQPYIQQCRIGEANANTSSSPDHCKQLPCLPVFNISKRQICPPQKYERQPTPVNIIVQGPQNMQGKQELCLLCNIGGLKNTTGE